MTGSTKTKKTITKPQVSQATIDSWLAGHPDVNPSGFTFSMLKDLKLTGSTKTVKSSADTKSLVSSAMTKTYEAIKKLKTGSTFSFSSITESLKSMSGQPKTGWGEPKSGTPRTLSAKTDIDYSKIPKKFRPIDKTVNFSAATKTFTPKIKLSGQTRQSLNLKTSLNQIDLTTLPITAGTIDYSFPNYVTNDTSFDDAVYAIAVQTDGKILVGGDFGNYYYSGSPYYSPYLIRLNSDGTVDETFSTTAGEDDYGGSFDNSVYTIAVQPDGKILVGGEFTTYDRNCCTYENVGRIIRLNSDGSRDLSFNVGSSGFNDSVYTIVVQPNGKILVGGAFYQYNDNQYERTSGLTSWRIIRLNENGSQDTTFDTGNGFDWDDYGNVGTIKLQPDGKILVGGNFYDFNGYMANNIVRLNSNGSYDTSFLMGIGFNNAVYSIDLQSDGKIIVGGNFQDYGYYNGTYLGGSGIVRLTSNGTLDNTFGFGFGNQVLTVTVLSDDKIVVGGDFNYYYPIFEDGYNIDLSANKLVRFNPDCTIDYSFYREYRFDGEVGAVAITPENDILVGGSFVYDGIEAPFEYFGKIHNPVSEYSYIYLVANNVCTVFGLCGATFTYITVGSNEPLNVGLFTESDLYSFVKPSGLLGTEVGCAVPTGLYGFPYPSTQVDYVVDKNYGDFFSGGCETAFVDNYKIAIVNPIFNDSFGIFPLLVDKNYKVGDFGFFNQYFDSSILSPFPVYFHVNFEILDFITVNDLGGPLLPISALPYIPYSSAEELVSANGQYIDVSDCNAPCGTYPLSKQYDICFAGKIISLDLCTNCGYVYQTISVFSDDNISYSYISGGTPTINSTKIWDSCLECAANNTPEGEVNYNFNFDEDGFNNDVYTIAEQTDGKLLVGGAFTTYDGNNVNYLTRLNYDGYIDETFNQIYSSGATWSTNTPFTGTGVGGSIYFYGYSSVSANTNVGVWEIGNNDFTFEWFQYFTGDTSKAPTVFSFGDTDLTVYFYSNQINIYINGEDRGAFLDSSISNSWHHFAITRESTEEDGHVWRVFQNGNEILTFIKDISYDLASTIIGKPSNYLNDNLGAFKGYITNFRVTNGAAIYTSNFTVPTEPLTHDEGPGNTILLLSALNQTDVILDSSDDEIATSTFSGYGFGKGFNSDVYAIAVQTDGKILVGGDFTSYNDEFAGHIIRLNSDGSIDNSFTYNTEFDGNVYAIAVQNDGKIVVGGDFSYYYDYQCYGYVRLNPDGTPDTTFKQYPYEGTVYSILLEDVVSTPGFYSNYRSSRYTQQNITIGGWYDMYIPKLELNINCLAKFGPDGTFINTYGQGFTSYYGGVRDMKKQSDGKLVCVGGFSRYQNQYCPFNIIRINTDGSQDTSFVGKISDDGGGFNDGWVYSLEILPNGKIMVGSSSQYFYDRMDNYNDLGFLVRLNSDGTLDTTFTYILDDDYVDKVLLRKDRTLLVGGEFNYPNNRLTNMFIGEYFQLRAFNTCDGDTANIYLPSTFKNISTLDLNNYNLNLMNFVESSYPVDDDYIVCGLPIGFSLDFLGSTYYSVNVSSNSYITFGNPAVNGGADTCCFNIPGQISHVGQPGVYISTACGPNSITNGLDDEAFFIYSGISKDGNSMIIRYIGGYHCDYNYPNRIELVYNFIFYKGVSDYFDLIIDENTLFYNGDPTGGTSNGSNAFIGTFNSSSGKSCRINTDGSITSVNFVKPIKANINTSNVVCGIVGDVITTPQGNGTRSGVGSMYFDGNLNTMVQIDNGDGQFGFNGLNDFTIEWFQYYEGGSNSRPFSIGVYGNPNEMIGMSFEGTVYLWIDDSSINTNIINDNLINGWHHIAITREYQSTSGANHIWKVFLDGVMKLQIANNTDTSNTYTLTLGNQLNNDGRFQGYITNFRVNNLTALYTSNFTVPTVPLTCDSNVILTMDASSELSLLTDSCNEQSISATGVTWSSNTPFKGLPEYYTSTNTTTTYDSCSGCTLTDYYNVILYVYGNTPYIKQYQMTLSDIQKVQTFGPLFTTGGVEAYEILTYFK